MNNDEYMERIKREVMETGVHPRQTKAFLKAVANGEQAPGECLCPESFFDENLCSMCGMNPGNQQHGGIHLYCFNSYHKN